MPCVELFRAQDAAYRQSLIPAGTKTVVVEAGSTVGWSSLVPNDPLVIGIDHYGASAPGDLLAEKFGFTGKAIKARVESFLKGSAV
jgi:transketolase